MNQAPCYSAGVSSVIARFEQPLLRYATRLVGDRELARDVVQDTFLRLMETRQSEIDRPKDWLYRVCHNRALDVVRKQRRASSFAYETKGPVAVPAVAERQRAVSELFELVDTLPAAQRNVMRMRFRDGQSYQRISARTGLSMGTVGSVLHVALGALRTRIGVATLAIVLIAVGVLLVDRPEPLEFRSSIGDSAAFLHERIADDMAEENEQPVRVAEPTVPPTEPISSPPTAHIPSAPLKPVAPKPRTGTVDQPRRQPMSPEVCFE